MISSARGLGLLWQFNERIFVFIFWIGFLVFLLFILDGENGVAFGFRDDEEGEEADEDEVEGFLGGLLIDTGVVDDVRRQGFVASVQRPFDDFPGFFVE